MAYRYERYLILAVLLLMPSISLAGGILINSHAFSGGTSCDDCSGDLKFAWHMENTTVTSGIPCGCSDGDVTATTNNSVVLSSTHAQDGTYSVRADGANEYYIFAVSGTDVIDDYEGKLIFYVYIDTWESSKYIFRASDADNSDELEVRMVGTSGSDIDFVATLRRGGAANSITLGTVAKSEDEWLYVEVLWKEGGDWNFKVCDEDGSSNCQDTAGGDSPLPASDNYTHMHIGLPNASITAADIYIDNIKIYGTSGL